MQIGPYHVPVLNIIPINPPSIHWLNFIRWLSWFSWLLFFLWILLSCFPDQIPLLLFFLLSLVIDFLLCFLFWSIFFDHCLIFLLLIIIALWNLLDLLLLIIGSLLVSLPILFYHFLAISLWYSRGLIFRFICFYRLLLLLQLLILS